MKQKISGLKAIGNGTYNDSRKRTIYGDLKNSKAYIVDNNNKRLYTILSSKTFLAISIGLLVGYYLSWPIGVVVGDDDGCFAHSFFSCGCTDPWGIIA